MQGLSFIVNTVAVVPFLFFSCQASQADRIQTGQSVIRTEDIKKHVDYLASPELEGRDTGEPGIEKAAEYLAKQFEQIGIEPFGDKGDNKTTYFQHFPITILEPDPDAGLKIYDSAGKSVAKSKLGEFRRLAGFQPWEVSGQAPIIDGGTVSLKTDAQPSGSRRTMRSVKIEFPENAEGAFVALKISDVGDLSNFEINSSIATAVRSAKAKGALVMPADPADENYKRIFKAGVVGGSREKRYGSPKPGMEAGTKSNNPPILAFQGSDAAGLLKGGKASFEVRMKVTEYKSRNIVGLIRGTDSKVSNTYIVHSAHYDHVGRQRGQIHPGADDNASGTTALLQMAKAYKAAGAPRRSVIFLLVSGEEKGLWGSEYFASTPPVDVKSMVANINTDMVGRSLLNGETKPGYMMLTPSPKNKEYNTLAARTNELAATYGFSQMVNGDIYWQRSDHYNFAKRGVPTMFLCNGEHEDYHRPGDTPDKIDHDKIARSAKLSFHVGFEIAQSDELPKALGAQKPASAPAGGKSTPAAPVEEKGN